MSQTVAVFPGSFDPLTNGHTDIIERASALFGRIVVGVVHNPNKHTLFSPEERVELIRQEFSGRAEIIAESFKGLLVDFVRQHRARIIIRGLRAVSDYDYEAQMALMNRHLASDIETFFLMAREDCSYISSSVVRQVAQFGGDVRALVPVGVARALEQRFARTP